MLHNRRTKIVATISSLACDVDFLRTLHEAGMDIARLNSAHMSIEEAARVVANIREVSDQIAILIDTKGPEVRTSEMAQPLEVKTGDRVQIGVTPRQQANYFCVNYPHFVSDIKVGQMVLIDDGATAMQVVSKNFDMLDCEIKNSGTIKNHKSVNAPGSHLTMPALTKKDRQFIDFAIEQNLDFIAHSFVRSYDDVMAVQSILDTSNSPIRIIAKIENQQGLNNLDEILQVAYGAMVARGDLGVEIPIEEVPEAQKRIIYECMRRRKVVITATQMLQSMIDSPRPTRAEVSDVANAVLDGTDAVMLSGETSAGNYPVEAVTMMAKIVKETEKIPRAHFTRVTDPLPAVNPIRGFLIRSAIKACEELPIEAIVSNTLSGYSPIMAASFRPMVPILATSCHPHVVRQLAMSYGVQARPCEYIQDPHQLMIESLNRLLRDGLLRPDSLIVYLGQLQSNDQSGSNWSAITTPAALLDGTMK